VVLDPFVGADQQDDPDDPADGRSGDQLAADAAARLVLQLKEEGATTWDGFGENLEERSLRWGDFLVLTRSRTEISLYEKAFREAGIPIVPPGRGMLAASREVQDILALLRWLTWPEDDVALASVLRSPIFRIGQKDFQEVLVRRGLFRTNEEGKSIPPKGLWNALRKGEDDPVTGPAVALLKNWRKHLGFESSHDLLRRVFREGLVLEKYQLALGDQARYNLMRLFDLALSPAMTGTPTVRRLADLIARAASQGGQEEGTLPGGGADGRVRFMTIHGAKGLEARVVILVDADRATGKESPRVRTDSTSTDTPLLFKVTKNYREGFQLPEEVDWPVDSLQIARAEAVARDRTEEANLLYVAMTRARDRLYVLGGDKTKADVPDSPLRRIRKSAEAGQCQRVTMQDPAWLERPPAPMEPVDSAHSADKDSIRVWSPPVLREKVKIVTPSTAESEMPAREPEKGAQSSQSRISGPGSEVSGIERGNRIHQLLQLAAQLGAMPPGVGEIHTEAIAVFTNPDLNWVFHPENGRGLCEVPVIHRRPVVEGRPEERITGSIDRLVLRPGRADIIDYKSNRLSDYPAYRKALCEHYRPQLEAYREVIAALFPDLEVHMWLLFTDPAAKSDPLSEIS
jgi:ATP-dependent helicase/nuclease subunit A